MNNQLHFFYEDLIPGVLNYISVFDCIVSLFYLLVILTIFYFVGNHFYKENGTLLLQTLGYKILMATFFVCFYVFYYGGGDGVAYWSLGNSLNELLWKNPQAYFDQMLHFDANALSVYSAHGIRCASWIAQEPESYFVAKIAAVFNLFTFGNLLASSLLIASLVTIASFRFYLFVLAQGFQDHFWLRVGVLFVPSVSFWCTGLNKDSILFVCLLFIVPIVFTWIKFHRIKFVELLGLVVCSWVMLQVRSIFFVVMLLPFILVIAMRSSKFFDATPVVKKLYQLVLVVGMFVGVGASIGLLSSVETVQSVLSEAEIVQTDFLQNVNYTGAKYDLGISDFSLSGILAKAPEAIIAGIFRPFPWEALSPVLILNGVESAVIIYLFMRYFVLQLRSKLKIIFEQELLLYAFLFILLLAFTTGLTSVLFGVLVRLRAPLLPFLFLLLSTQRFNFTSKTLKEDIDK